jgi:hypothetical protein
MADPMESHWAHGKSQADMHGKPPSQSQAPQATAPKPITSAPALVSDQPQTPIKTILGSPIPSRPITENVEDLLVNDPKRFIEKVREEVREENNGIQQRKNATEKMWKEFYETNPDLKDVDWHVQSVLGQKLQEWWDKPVPEATKLLAEESRRRLDLLRSKTGVRVENLESRKAEALPSSGDPAPRVQTPAPQETNFVQEIRDLRKKQRKV